MSTKTVKECESCALWDIDKARSKSGRVRSGSIAKCRWESTEIRPASVATYSSLTTGGWTNPHDGTDCLCWIERKGEA